MKRIAGKKLPAVPRPRSISISSWHTTLSAQHVYINKVCSRQTDHPHLDHFVLRDVAVAVDVVGAERRLDLLLVLVLVLNLRLEILPQLHEVLHVHGTLRLGRPHELLQIAEEVWERPDIMSASEGEGVMEKWTK